jgi:hypothetical protein
MPTTTKTATGTDVTATACCDLCGAELTRPRTVRGLTLGGACAARFVVARGVYISHVRGQDGLGLWANFATDARLVDLVTGSVRVFR